LTVGSSLPQYEQIAIHLLLVDHTRKGHVLPASLRRCSMAWGSGERVRRPPPWLWLCRSARRRPSPSPHWHVSRRPSLGCDPSGECALRATLSGHVTKASGPPFAATSRRPLVLPLLPRHEGLWSSLCCHVTKATSRRPQRRTTRGGGEEFDVAALAYDCQKTVST